MITDPPPKAAKLRKLYDASDARGTLPLPPADQLQSASHRLADALAADDKLAVQRAGDALCKLLAAFYGVATPGLTVLGVRPLKVVGGDTSYELFGDYAPDSQKIRAWMRTAVLGKVTSHRGLLNTLLHEFCHHLDVHSLGFTRTPHTRGFFHRVDDLYHLALATSADKRKPLRWILTRRGSYRIDWNALRATSELTR